MHVKLVGVEIDNKLTFDRHVEALCQKVNKKTSETKYLRRRFCETKYLHFQRTRTINMECGDPVKFQLLPFEMAILLKSANKKIDRAHKRALGIFYNDYDSLFQSLLPCSNRYTIHVKKCKKVDD